MIPVVADLDGVVELPGLGESLLDGAVFANSLHFIRDAEGVLRKLVSFVKPGGRVVFVEYDRRGPNPWVPYPIASERLPAYYDAAKSPKGDKNASDYKTLRKLQGSELRGTEYEPLLPFFADHPNSFRVLVDDFVSTSDGTGVVHMAPAYGEDDYRICRREGIELVDPLDEECRFTSRVPDYAGQFCKDADKAIIRRLKDEGKVFRQDTIVHAYPFDYRTDTPLVYRAIDAWYVRIEDIRDRMATLNESISWVPEAVGKNRFGNWLRDARDWNISRNRYWGSCLPIRSRCDTTSSAT